MDIRWVKQEHERGCGHAALAMLTGESYADLAASCETDPATEGLYERHIDCHLFNRGYAIRRFYRGGNLRHEPWPPEPFANAHLCNVKVHEGGLNHFVVMLRDGSILDPLHPEPKRLTDYHDVQNVAGVYKVS